MNPLSSFNTIVKETEHFLHINHEKGHNKSVEDDQQTQHFHHHHHHHRHHHTPTKVTTKLTPEGEQFAKDHPMVLSLSILSAGACQGHDTLDHVSTSKLNPAHIDMLRSNSEKSS